MNINDLFCTPEQGRRLQELVPELYSTFMWGGIMLDRIYRREYAIETYTYSAPALTLQELRDYAYTADFVKDGDTSANGKWFAFGVLVRTATASELADWVIERLEEVKR